MNRVSVLPFVLLCALPTSVWSQRTLTTPAAPGLKAVDDHTLIGDEHLVSGNAPRTAEGLIRVVVEIPAGTNAKWEVAKDTGHLKWEIKNGKPRIVQYLAYPGNYGMVPRTLLPKELGGDGDPLDVLVLGPAVLRGAVIEAKLIGVLRLLDAGEQDDKLIAVIPGKPLGDVSDLSELDRKYPGVSEIIETWFANYKGADVIETRGFMPTIAAQEILRSAIDNYEATTTR
jgi:inorganic pyrophosphatase